MTGAEAAADIDDSIKRKCICVSLKNGDSDGDVDYSERQICVVGWRRSRRGFASLNVFVDDDLDAFTARLVDRLHV